MQINFSQFAPGKLPIYTFNKVLGLGGLKYVHLVQSVDVVIGRPFLCVYIGRYDVSLGIFDLLDRSQGVHVAESLKY